MDTPVSDTPKLDGADSASFSDRARQPLRKIGAVIVSIAAVGAVVGGLSGYWNFWKTVKTDLFHESQVGGKSAKTAISSGLIVSKGPSVAVLPVTNPATAAALEPVAATITQQLASSLGKFSTLRVMPRATAANFVKHDDTVEAARKAGVDYLVTGEVRPLGEGARASIQVADLHSGTEIWSKSFDASAEGVRTETDAYEIGDAAAAQIGAYPGAISIADYKKIQSKPVAELNSYQCIISAVIGGAIGSSSAGLRALECSKRLTEDEPNNALAWAARTLVLFNQRFVGFGLAPDQAQHVEKRLYLNEEIMRTATRAIELAPDDAYVRRLFALAIGTKCQIDLFRPEVQKVLSLSSNDPALGALGISLAFMGDWDEGSAIAEKAIRLAGSNSSYSWWYGPAKRHWWRGEYQEALEDFRHAYLDGLWLSHLQAAYTLPFLGRLDDAKTEVTKLLKLRPDFTIREADAFYRMFCFSPEYIEKMNDALRQAGLPE